MEYKNDKLGARFVVPDKITVRQQLAYVSEATYRTEAERIENSWIAATGLITEWDCPRFSLEKIDLSTETDPMISRTIIWASSQVENHINSLENVPKN